MERLNQPPNTECCGKQGQAGLAAGEGSRTTFSKRTQGTSQAVSGIRTPLKQSSLETVNAGGDVVASTEPNMEAIARGVRLSPACRGRSAWHAKKETTETWETRHSPDAPTAGANRVGAFNDKKNAPTLIRESDRFVVASLKLAKEPTPSRSPHRKPVPRERRSKAGQPPCGP